MAFKGWLIKFGNTVLPNKYLEKYKSTPNQRLELDASRDATALLHRQTSPNYKTSLTVPIRKLYLGVHFGCCSVCGTWLCEVQRYDRRESNLCVDKIGVFNAEEAGVSFYQCVLRTDEVKH